VVFVLSAVMAGIAGALYVPQVGIINPSEFAPANSIEAVIWVAIGGRTTLVGPIVGAVLANFAKTYLTTGVLAEYWLYLLGAAFIAVTLFLPRGIVGTLADALSRKPPALASPSSELTTAAREDLPPATSNPQAAE
jgi:urea transport system permease protein